MIISAPQPSGQFATQEDQLASAVDTTTTGVKLSYTVPAGVTAELVYAANTVNTGTNPTVQLQVKRGATTFSLNKTAGSWNLQTAFPLAAGDIVQLNCTVTGAASTCDMALGIIQDAQAGRVTISFTDPATLDIGMTLYPGNPPSILLYDHFGSAIHENVTAISANGNSTIAVVDFFGSQLQELQDYMSKR